MHKLLVRRPGGHRALEWTETAEPVAMKGQVLVRVAAAGVNYADCLVRMGWYSAAKGRYPLTPGFEFAGTVEAVGPGAGRFSPGERVFGLLRFGAYAEKVVVDERWLWRCPAAWSLEDCAAFPTVFLTAWYGLLRAARVEPGELVLVPSAAGGVGSALLQLCAACGCPAVGIVGSEEKVAAARAHGARAVIVRGTRDPWKAARAHAPEGYDVVFDSGGPQTLREGYALLSKGGRLVVYGFAELFPRGAARPNPLGVLWRGSRVPRFSPLELTSANRGVLGFNVVHLFDRPDLASRAMEQLLGWIAEGKVRPLARTDFPAERAAQAHAALESGATVGKLVLVFAPI
ncbi:MAG: zinc-binding dehydrogenase [Elusimicrobiota bacterium]|jgi:NADPH:quinone reductase-like Zn-dependent oxidoreductase